MVESLSRNPLVGGILATSTDTIELTAAVTLGTPAVVRTAIDSVGGDLPSLLQTHGYAPLGLPTLREAIAATYRTRGLPTSAEQVLVTSGAQQAISLVAQALLEPGDRVLVEDPTFIVALDTFRMRRAEIAGLPIGPKGPNPEALRTRLSELRPALTYLVPTNQNPTGATTPEATRRAIAAMVAETDLTLIEDEAVAGLEFGSRPTPPPIASFAPDAAILSIASLSKRAWGGLRLGWIRGPLRTISQLGRLKVIADYGTSTVSQAVAIRVLERLADLETERRAEISAAADLFERLLGEHLPDWRWDRPTGGLTAWLQLPFGDAGAFAQVALRHGVAVVPGAMMSISGGHTDRIRLTYADAAQLPEGIARLGAAWRAYRSVAHDEEPRRLAWVV